MNLFVRAIITGFGLRLGSELAKLVTAKLLPQDEHEDGDEKEDDDDDSLGSVTADPPDLSAA